MSAGVFVIQELRRVNGASGAALDGDRFEWVAGTEMPGPNGGARAAPLGTLDLGISLHTVRTDYPGARTPSGQVLGVRRKALTLNGKWDDRWNFPGYAVKELQRMEALVTRGRMCRIQFQGQALEGLIIECDTPYKGDWLIKYAITVDVYNRPEDYQPNRSPPGPLTPLQRFDDAALAIAVLQAGADTVPAGALGGTLADDVDGELAGAVVARDSLGATLDQRDLRPAAQGTSSLPRLASQFTEVGAAAQRIVDQLIAARSDLDVTVMTAKNVLAFESWSRSMRFNARLLLGTSLAGADDMAERASPSAERMYQPYAGESLYQVSRKFYGTPHAWRLIAQRNGLDGPTPLTGGELLIIPEREQG